MKYEVELKYTGTMYIQVEAESKDIAIIDAIEDFKMYTEDTGVEDFEIRKITEVE